MHRSGRVTIPYHCHHHCHLFDRSEACRNVQLVGVAVEEICFSLLPRTADPLLRKSISGRSKRRGGGARDDNSSRVIPFWDGTSGIGTSTHYLSTLRFQSSDRSDIDLNFVVHAQKDRAGIF
jgi:hypothetical protein